MNKLLITRQGSTKEAYLMALLDEQDKLIEADLYPLEQTSSYAIGTICIGKVKNIAGNLNAAFVEVAKGQTCYLSLEHSADALFTRQARAGMWTEGDEVVVQVQKEGIKTKFPLVSTKLELTGEYLVLTSYPHRVGYSSKLSEARKKQLKQLFHDNAEQADAGYGLIVRTNASLAEDEAVLLELETLKEEYMEITAGYMHRTCYSVLKPAKAFYQEKLDNLYKGTLKEIITDEPDIYESLCQKYRKKYSGTHRQDGTCDTASDMPGKIRLYQEDAVSLWQVYSLESQLEKARMEKVWLKSGAYLVIQPTEALTVIDVNSGKNNTKKNAQEYYYRINEEAAKMTARQLRLRNLSGIIVVDFINMADEAARQKLMHSFKSYLRQDPVAVQLIDITKLGLVELTRKKQRPTLAAQWEQLIKYSG